MPPSRSHDKSWRSFFCLQPVQCATTRRRAEPSAQCRKERLSLQFCEQRAFPCANFRFIALIKRPLLYAFAANQAGLRQNLQVFTRRGMAYSKLPRDQHAADAIPHQVPVHLRREMTARILQPCENLQPIAIRKGSKNGVTLHPLSPSKMAVVHLAKCRSTMKAYHGCRPKFEADYARGNQGVLSKAGSACSKNACGLLERFGIRSFARFACPE